MIKLTSLDGVRADTFVFRTPSVALQIIVCKLTVHLAPGVSELAEPQEEIVRREEHWGGDPRRSVYRVLDSVPTKRRAEAVVVGHAHAQSPEGANALIARLLVGSVDKAIEVHAPRRFEPDGSLSQATRFQRSPLGWENASGGAGSDNPIGVDTTVSDAYGKTALPSLQPPGLHVAQPGTAVGSVSFAPVAAGWPRRLRLSAGATGWAAGELANDVWPDAADYTFFNAAPIDQQSEDAFRPDERIVLEHLHPDHARLVTNLPGMRPRAAIVRGQVAEEIDLVFDTLWIDADRGVATLTFRGRISDTDDPRATIAIALERPERRFPIGELCTRLSAAKAAKLEALAGATVAATDVASLGVLPFIAKSDAAPPPRSRRSPEEIERLTTGTIAADGSTEVAIASPAPVLTPVAAVREPAVVLGAPVEAASRGGYFAPSQSQGFDRPMTIGMATPEMPQATAKPIQRSQPIAPIEARQVAAKALTPLRAKRTRGTAREALRPAVDVRVELCWFDESAMPAARRARQALETAQGGWVTREGAAKGDRAEIQEILVHGRPAALVDLELLWQDALDRGEADPPVVLVQGELVIALDERAALKSTIALMSPLGPTDKRLADALASAEETSKATDLPLDVFSTARARLEEAFRAQSRPLSYSSVTDAVVRALVESRAHQRRTLWGETRVRSSVGQDQFQVPLYLPTRAADELPLMHRIHVRAIAEVRGQQDAQDTGLVALRPIAIGRHWVPKATRSG